jgi:hypothetical protein
MSSACRKIYIAGPMRGYPELNFPAFHDAADRFRRAGWTVRNPVEIGRDTFGPDSGAVSPSEFLRADLVEVLTCDAMAVLPGWAKSTGARCEAAVALAVGLAFFDAETMEEIEPPAEVTVNGYSLPPTIDAAVHSAASQRAGTVR